jgi:hypothetical protein
MGIRKESDVNDIERHLQSILLQQRGNNHVLVNEIIEKLSLESKRQLFFILKDLDTEISVQRSKAKMFGRF